MTLDLKNEKYTVSKDVLEQVLTALSDNWFGGPRGEYNNDDIIDAQERLEKVLEKQHVS